MRKKMDIKIFEDQTGLMMFPEKGLGKTSSRNGDIVKLFDNKIDLRIINGEDLLEITCYLLVHRGQERAIGCYITGKDKYTDRTFENFKKDANDALKSIGFEHNHDNEENVVFDHMEKFDIDGQYHKDIDLIVEARNSGEHVGYKGGNIGEIAVLCRQILKRIGNIDIVISTVESNLGHVNVIRSNVYNEQLSPTVQGKQVLDRQIKKAEQRRIEENRKLEEQRRAEEQRKLKENEDRIKEEEEKNKQRYREIVDRNIDKGITLIEEGLDIKRRAGYDGLEINSYVEVMNDVINGKLDQFPSDKIENDEKGRLDEDGRHKKEEKIKQGEIGNDKIKEGAFIVKDAFASKRKDGYTDFEISSDVRIRNSHIIVRPYIPNEENKKYDEHCNDVKQEDTIVFLVGNAKISFRVSSIKIFAIVIIVIAVWLLASSLFHGSQCALVGNGDRESLPCRFANIAVNIIDLVPIRN
jgi:hypothetical protein